MALGLNWGLLGRVEGLRFRVPLKGSIRVPLNLFL